MAYICFFTGANSQIITMGWLLGTNGSPIHMAADMRVTNMPAVAMPALALLAGVIG